MYEFSTVLLFLAAYSFLGWVAEVLFVLFTSHVLQNRGFLTGPFVPIYGVGALLLIYVVDPYIDNPFLVFAASLAITSALEFFTHLALDKIFHVRLWDYSDKPHNLQGRICLQNSLLFGVLGLLLLYVIHPAFTTLIDGMPHEVAIAVAFLLLGILVIDAANSIRTLAKVKPVLDEMKGTLAEAHARVETASVRVTDDVAAERDRLHAGTLGRLSAAFPHARSTRAARPGPGAN
jgi:uncharacterized membrane protein